MQTGSWVGFRHRGGERTNEITKVVAVDRKLPRSEIPASQVLPPSVDVVEAEFTAYALTDHVRPVQPGYSIGHGDVTAGTLGLWVRRIGLDGYLGLSNNHVIANSNDATLGDTIYQPGIADTTGEPQPLGTLTAFVPITFLLPDKKTKGAARAWWKAWSGIANAGARAVKCPNRLVVQQTGNYVDAALFTPNDPADVDLRVAITDVVVQGGTSLALGDMVVKSGRTTGFTVGLVEGVNASINVGYGGTRTALFEDQVIIRGVEGEFSAPGDSGSAILTDPEATSLVGGLLFAGGSGITIANRWERVVAALGVEAG